MGWIVYGPQGCGKTLNAKKIAKHLGVPFENILDEVRIMNVNAKSLNTMLKESNVLMFTHDDLSNTHDHRAISFFEIMKEINNGK